MHHFFFLSNPRNWHFRLSYRCELILRSFDLIWHHVYLVWQCHSLHMIIIGFKMSHLHFLISSQTGSHLQYRVCCLNTSSDLIPFIWRDNQTHDVSHITYEHDYVHSGLKLNTCELLCEIKLTLNFLSETKSVCGCYRRTCSLCSKTPPSSWLTCLTLSVCCLPEETQIKLADDVCIISSAQSSDLISRQYQSTQNRFSLSRGLNQWRSEMRG